MIEATMDDVRTFRLLSGDGVYGTKPNMSDKEIMAKINQQTLVEVKKEREERSNV